MAAHSAVNPEERAALQEVRKHADALAVAVEAANKLGLLMASIDLAGGTAKLSFVRQTPINLDTLNN